MELAALLRRNARYRAWFSLGLVLRCRWVSGLRAPGSDAPGLDVFRAECPLCGDKQISLLLPKDGEPASVLASAARMDEVEQRALHALMGRGCPHAAPVFGPAPHALEALTELELLAGPG